MKKRGGIPVALTVAGSDSGGGAGVQADLKVFAALGVHGTSVLTCVTAQNPKEVRGVESVKPAMVRAQLEAVVPVMKPAAIKTGMLYSRGLIREVAAYLAEVKAPLVVDPVMVATSGAVLLRPEGVRAMTQELFPKAELITPNLDEAELLLGRPIGSIEEMRQAARDMRGRWGCATLMKGGHLRGKEAVDIYWDGRLELMLSAPFIRGVSTHGTGCTYSAAIAGYRARGEALAKAVELGKQFITEAIAGSYRVAGFSALQPFGWSDRGRWRCRDRAGN